MKRSVSRLLSPSVSVIVSVVIIAFVYRGCSLNFGSNRNRNVSPEAVNAPVVIGNYNGPVVRFNDPDASGFTTTEGERIAPMDVTVKVTSDGFFPASVTVATGGTVTWTNEDDVPHQPDADDGSSRTAFSAPVAIERDERFRHTFTAPGSVAYHDDRNPAFRGVIIVR